MGKVPYNIAYKLKEVGFNYPCRECYLKSTGDLYTDDYFQEPVNHNEYEDTVSAPEIEIVLKWFREVHTFIIWTEPIWNSESFTYMVNMYHHTWGDLRFICIFGYVESDVGVDFKEYSTYENAILDGIEKSCEYL